MRDRDEKCEVLSQKEKTSGANGDDTLPSKDGATYINLESVFLLDQLQERDLVHQESLKGIVEEGQLLEPRQLVRNGFYLTVCK